MQKINMAGQLLWRRRPVVAQELLEDQEPALRRRGALRLRVGGQHRALREQPDAPLRRTANPHEPRRRRAEAVVRGQSLIDERIVRGQQALDAAAILQHHLIQIALRLLHQRSTDREVVGQVGASDARGALVAEPVAEQLLHHRLPEHRLLSLDALAALGENLPAGQVEYNPGDVPIGIAPEDVPSNGLSIGETIRTIDTNRSWAVLKNIETVPDYRALLMDLLGELAPVVEPRTGAMLTPQGFVFISSPGSITPFHFDPEHNILLQLRGTKVMHVWPSGDERFAHLNGNRSSR